MTLSEYQIIIITVLGALSVVIVVIFIILIICYYLIQLPNNSSSSSEVSIRYTFPYCLFNNLFLTQQDSPTTLSGTVNYFISISDDGNMIVYYSDGNVIGGFWDNTIKQYDNFINFGITCNSNIVVYYGKPILSFAILNQNAILSISSTNTAQYACLIPNNPNTSLR